MVRNRYDPAVEERLKSLQTRLSTGVFRSATMEQMDGSLSEIQHAIDTALRNCDLESLKCESVTDLYKLSIASAGIARAKIESEKLKLEATDQYERARAEIQEYIRREFEAFPELRAKVARVEQLSAAKLARALKSKSKGKKHG